MPPPLLFFFVFLLSQGQSTDAKRTVTNERDIVIDFNAIVVALRPRRQYQAFGSRGEGLIVEASCRRITDRVQESIPGMKRLLIGGH